MKNVEREFGSYLMQSRTPDDLIASFGSGRTPYV
jgi:hypothetical protein